MNQANWLRCLKLIEDLFIYDTKEDESDVGVGYAAKTNDDGKILHDLRKVIKRIKKFY